MAPAWDMLSGPAVVVAPQLLGSYLVHELDGGLRLVGKIVETEAYDQTDAASHSYKGRTPRTNVMFGPAGHLYVYFTYGMHYCCNVVTGREGEGSAVLLRAVEPLEGVELMSRHRHDAPPSALTNGPAKLCQAFAIDKAYSGHDLRQPPLQLVLQPPLPAADIGVSPRVGITKAADKPWRFYSKSSSYVSKAA